MLNMMMIMMMMMMMIFFNDQMGGSHPYNSCRNKERGKTQGRSWGGFLKTEQTNRTSTPGQIGWVLSQSTPPKATQASKLGSNPYPLYKKGQDDGLVKKHRTLIGKSLKREAPWFRTFKRPLTSEEPVMSRNHDIYFLFFALPDHQIDLSCLGTRPVRPLKFC